MTRYAMVADLRRCIGCQTCTAACKQANATPPGVQWRRVLDMEVGDYPDVRRVFVPTGCQHCADPPCEWVCPTTATRRRPDGIVQIVYDLCIGCAACAVACPYEARYKVEKREFAFGEEPTVDEELRADNSLIGVATKCTFCADIVDAGVARGLRPGRIPRQRLLALISASPGRSRLATLTIRKVECPSSSARQSTSECTKS